MAMRATFNMFHESSKYCKMRMLRRVQMPSQLHAALLVLAKRRRRDACHGGGSVGA